MDEARTVIRRLERIDELRSAHAPAAELLGEVRQLLAEGEAWIAAENRGAMPGVAGAVGGLPTDGAAVALAGCRELLAGREEAVPGTAGHAPL
jgi:hypothetical protein